MKQPKLFSGSTLIASYILTKMIPEIPKSELILVAGGGGFIGSHVARTLRKAGYRVRIADLTPRPSPAEPIDSEIEMLKGNLCDLEFCKLAVAGAHTVLHFAANMGGMGVIHSANDYTIYAENHAMTLNLIASSVLAEAKTFLYASSACVYPNSLQGVGRRDVSLRESDVFAAPPPFPQGLYGLEKLNSELLLKQYDNRIQIHIARFHNIYGPGGAWHNGREKAPAAMLRKAFTAKLLANESPGSPPAFEIWGTGVQRRSFLFIDDAVKAIQQLLNSNCSSPVNIGSDRSVTINDLATIALQCAEIQPSQVRFEYDEGKPAGVGSRNSNNDFSSKSLGWKPETSLEEGMRQTGLWIKQEIDNMTKELDEARQLPILRSLQNSAVVDLASEVVRFAILLPITSRGLEEPSDCLNHLASFARSLRGTTWRNSHELGSACYRVTVYLSIDHDDVFLSESNKPRRVLRENGIFDVVTLEAHHPKGDVCSHWRECAQRAWKDGCDYLVLMGDDVVLQDEGWMEDIHAEYSKIAAKEMVPQGFGCVAFTDTTFPGMPTFPIIHKTHMDIFSGEVVPKVFVNQDGDPFLFQLYRRWGCSKMIRSRIRNNLGGSEKARYEKKHAIDWTFQTLDVATTTVEGWLGQRSPQVNKKLTIDIVIPCYRVNISYLDAILNLKPSSTCSVMFIIIVDDPRSPSIQPLRRKYHHRPDVRIRVNDKNIGASASRNRGMKESSAEWVHFLDDDVTPKDNLLLEAETAIRNHPNAAGFVGNAQFPSADSIFTAAIHLAGVTYFWDISTKMYEDLPWGVTANLIARRNVEDGVEYDLGFPKTGGGEDIDFCLKKRDWSVKNGREGFWPAPEVMVTHPWWYEGTRTYWRFYGWSKGDGALVKMYPEFRYTDVAPNSAELLFGCIVFLVPALIGLPFYYNHSVQISILGVKAILAIVMANMIHDLYRHLWRDSARTESIKTSVGGVKWILAVLESSLIRMTSEMGRAVGMIERRESRYLGKRFDWFTNRAGSGPRCEERKNALQRVGLFIALLSML